MSINAKTRSALRATVKQEDAALSERLPAAAEAASKAAPPPGQAQAAATPLETAVEAAPPAPEPSIQPAPKPKASAKARPKAKAPATATTTPRKAAARNAPAEGPAKLAKRTPKAAKVAPPPVATAAPEAMPILEESGAGKKGKREKVVRDSFSMPASEHRQIKALREALGKAGRLASKSEVLRAGLSLVCQRSPAEAVALLDALPAVAKGKRAKKH